MKLLVQVIEARGLASKDSNGFSDPYVRLQLGWTKVKTKVVPKSLNPSWHEEFSFKLDDLKSELLVTVWDRDAFTDDFLGQIKLPVSQVLHSDKQVVLPTWYTLQKRRSKPKDTISGEILLGLSLYGRTYNASEASSHSDKSAALGLPSSPSLPTDLSSNSDSSTKSYDKEDLAIEKQKAQHKTFGQKVGLLFTKKSHELGTAAKDSQHNQSSQNLLPGEQGSTDKDGTLALLSFFDNDAKYTGVSEEDLPAPLQGGILIDKSYATGFKALNAILFKPGSPFLQELMVFQGTTNLVEEPWLISQNGLPKRVVSYTKAATKLVKAVKATEEQYYSRADDKGFVVNISCSTPDVPFGNSFRTELQMIIAPGPNLPSGDKTSHLCISWHMKFSQSTMMKGMIEGGARQGLKESYQQFAEVLDRYAKVISNINVTPNAFDAFAADDQETAMSDLELAADYFSNPAVILTIFSTSLVALHIYFPRLTSWMGLEFLGLDLPDSFGELLTSSLITLQVEYILKLAMRSLQTRVCIAGDTGIKAQGEGWLLKATLLEGECLCPSETSRSADPYVIFTCNGMTRTSSVKFQTPNPHWKEVFEFDATEDPPSTMDIEVFDFEGPFSEGESLGCAEINFLKSRPEELADFWIPLSGKNTESAKSRLHLHIFLTNSNNNSYVFPNYVEKMEKEVGEKIVRSAKRNLSFQKIFSLPAEEFLINDFACALKRKMSLQGRLFLSPRMLGFYSNIFGKKLKFSLLWEDIDDIAEATPSHGSVGPLFSPSILIFVRKGRAADAQHGAKSIDPKGRQKFQFQSFVRTGLAFRTIMALWKNRTLSLEKQMEVVSNVEHAEGEEQADDTGDFLGLEEAKMEEVYSTILPLSVESMMLIYEREHVGERIMEKIGGSMYTSMPWEPIGDKPGVQQRQLSYKLTRRLCQFGSTVTSVQQKEVSLDGRFAAIDEILTLHDVPFGDHFQVQVRKELQILSMEYPSSSCKVYVGIAWYKGTAFQKRITQNVFENFTKYLQESLDLSVKEVLALKEEQAQAVV